MGKRIADREGEPWTHEEDATLVREWSDCTKRTIMSKIPGRKWLAIFQRATAKHKLAASPQGLMPLKAAARMAGFHQNSFELFCETHGVKVTVAPRPRSRKRFVRRFVLWDDVQQAVARWARSETTRAAVKRLGVPALASWLVRARIRLGPRERMLSAWFDLVLKARGWFPGAEQINDASRRHGIAVKRLRTILRDSWVGGLGAKQMARGTRMFLHPEAVDRVVALWRRKQARAKAEARCGTQAEGEGQTISADTRIVCEPASPCSPVRRTKSPTMGRANR